MCGDNGKITQILDILLSMDSWNLTFDGGFKKFMGIVVMEILFPINYVLHK